MAATAAPAIVDSDVFTLTVSGQAQLDEAETALSKEALELLVLIDGKVSAGQLSRSVPGVKPADARGCLAGLLEGGYIRPAKGHEAIEVLDFTSVALSDDIPSSPEGERSISALERAGYYVRIARRPKAPHEKRGARLAALVVDDDMDICNLLKTYLKLEDFDVVTAGNRAEVIDAFRRPAPFDLVLLDVQLPDIDGFAILAKMRQHPALKDVPVIMLTASATRAAVLKGLHYGADGYVTKPFQLEPLLKAVRTVLGIEEAVGAIVDVPAAAPTSADAWGSGSEPG